MLQRLNAKYLVKIGLSVMLLSGLALLIFFSIRFILNTIQKAVATNADMPQEIIRFNLQGLKDAGITP